MMEQLCLTCHLGKMMNQPQPISGGLLHKMYKVTTDKGIYAIKLLNSTIMQRKGALQNMINSERISHALQKEVPVVSALSINDNCIFQLEHNYYMIFHWMEGSSIFPPNISEEHCREIGSILGKIHKKDIAIPDFEKTIEPKDFYDWNYYLREGKNSNAPWLKPYSEIVNRLIVWNQLVVLSYTTLSKNQVISHRDLDTKNVMWNKGKPYLIDWEAAGYINPYQELLEVLNYWADDGHGNLHKNMFLSLLDSYSQSMSIENVDWDQVFHSGYDGMLEWLDYNLKRALGIECLDDAERKLGEAQIVQTIEALKQYENKMLFMREWINNR